MTETFQILILLLVVISAIAVVARRLEVPPAILLVITGVGLALIPGLPTLQLAPDLVLVLVTQRRTPQGSIQASALVGSTVLPTASEPVSKAHPSS
jgi:Kef-type K+ transport system membrane component KefB